ncbi:MAG: hypothetical protein NT170_03715 [Candidatus Moranbacteria bacterium]|nr:hypothetical protein [Candidatus Moranbacteria bacterium]
MNKFKLGIFLLAVFVSGLLAPVNFFGKNSYEKTLTISKVEAKKKKKKKKKTNKKDPVACFNASSDNQYSDSIFYKGRSIALDAGCSQNATEYLWYLDGENIGSGKTFNKLRTNFSSRNKKKYEFNAKIGVEYKIKLIVIAKSGKTKSLTKVVSFRSIPNPVVCFNQESSNVKTFRLGQEYLFAASCSTYLEENPITKYTWKFRDGGISDAVVKEGVSVVHSFSKPATTVEGSSCGSNKWLEVELDIETKLGNNSANIHHYCIE